MKYLFGRDEDDDDFGSYRPDQGDEGGDDEGSDYGGDDYGSGDDEE